ncbi:MAG: response regulator transcription factor [Bacteroides sp.]|nr:response regulator transcription factor [Bacteroides sp.]MBD5347558.1 response regulator transcription factor [Bacteroides sp.]
MNPLRTLIIDDEPIALEKLRNYVDKLPFLELTGACRDGVEAARFLAETPVDLVFTDINMPDLNGLELVESLHGKAPMIVFTTAYAQYAVDSYKLAAVDYLLKPYSFADFQRAASKAYAIAQRDSLSAQQAAPPAEPATQATSDSLFVKIDYRYVRINTADIRYIKGYGEYLQIFVTNQPAPLITLSSFSAIAGKLPANFLQIHRSYIVNMNHVEHIVRNRVVMGADEYLPIGDSYKNTLTSWLRGHTVGPVPGRSE